jgi:hypothetical protein
MVGIPTAVLSPLLPEINATVQLLRREQGYARSTGLLAVAELRGCQRVRTWLDTLDGQDTTSGKSSIEVFIEEFPGRSCDLLQVVNFTHFFDFILFCRKIFLPFSD